MKENPILVVDDDISVLTVLAEMLAAGGYSIYKAESGAEALEILNNTDINVMFLDLNMPEMTGLELCGIIRKNQPDAVITAVTGFSDRYSQADIEQAGFNKILYKPVNIKKLYETAEAAFNKLNL
jgi:CheY-like chemotaxis protein